jgi:mono/diheme cytochrome c family protein
MTKGLWVSLVAWMIVLATAQSPAQGSAQGLAQGSAQGSAQSTAQGSAQSTAQGSAQSTAQGTAQGKAQSTAQGTAQGKAQGALLNQYCVTCHNQRAKTGGLALDTMSLSDIPAGAETWEKVIRKVRGGQMPPAGMPRPAQASLDALVAHLETSIDRAAFASPRLRHASIHRLNRSEYANAIRDLFALNVDVSALLPPDEEAYGFDNNATVLNISTSLMERYLSAAWKIASLAVASPKITPSLETFRVRGDLSQHDHVPGLPTGTRGGIAIDHYFPVDGEYVISPRLYRETVNIVRGLELEHDLEVTLDGQRIVLARFGGPKDEQANYLQPSLAGDEMEKRFQKRLKVTAGPHTVGVAFLKKSSAPTVELLQPFERERLDPITPVGIPELDKVTIEGPFNATRSENAPSRAKVFTCNPPSRSALRRDDPPADSAGATLADDEKCARTILSSLARRAYRGPVSDADMTRLLDFYAKERSSGGDFDAGIEGALRFLLVHPRFLYRVEQDPASIARGATYRVSDLELASRLSFFIWSSIPDDELLTVATAGRLKNPVVLEQQVRRMLKDERARALGSNFAGQWLYLRNLRGLQPDADVFPDFDHNLREAVQRETELLFESIVLEDKPVTTLLNADYTYLNERLARHYGVPNVYGTQFRRVAVTDDARKGLLGHASVLALTSQNNRTSPVLRGKYVLSNILGTPPPSPPAVVPPLDENPGKAKSMRDRMEEHRKSPACSGCHKLMDPIGLALENFDGIGRWRTTDNGAIIDAASQLADGTAIDGPAALRRAILRNPDMFVRNTTEMLLSYGIGHGIEYYDMPFVRAIVKDAQRSGYTFSSLVLGIVKSAPFQSRSSWSE